jgi:hypothetical protein
VTLPPALPPYLSRPERSDEPAFATNRSRVRIVGAFAEQYWGEWTSLPPGPKTVGIAYAECLVCEQKSWWLTDPEPQMVWPRAKPGVPPSPEMPDAPKALYDEARAIAQDSPRAAVALLRVATEILITEVVPDAKGSKGSLNDVVAQAVKNGLTAMAQQTLDALRVIGNDAVHPKQLVLDEANTREIYGSLCRLLNLVVDQLVTAPRLAQDWLRKCTTRSRNRSGRR